MNLAEHRFFQDTFHARATSGEIVECYRFGYETHKGIFDIDCYPGNACVFKWNMRRYPKQPIHDQVIKHFAAQLRSVPSEAKIVIPNSGCQHFSI